MDGSELAVSGSDGIERLYFLDGNALVSLAEQRLTRGFSLDEQQKYLHMQQCPMLDYWIMPV